MPNAYQSRAEREISSALTRYCIPFIYEKPTAVIDAGKTKIWYPDFTLPYGVLIEYFGINGSHDYRERTKHKLKVYEENQFEVVDLYPADLRGSWHQRFLNRIDSTLEHQLADYRRRIAAAQRHRQRPRKSRSMAYSKMSRLFHTWR